MLFSSRRMTAAEFAQTIPEKKYVSLFGGAEMKANSAMPAAQIEGIVRSDSKTKRLLRTISPGEIALIRHADLDEPAADGLLAAGVKAVVNADRTMTGAFPHEGPFSLLIAGIPIMEIDAEHFGSIPDGASIVLDGGLLRCDKLAVPIRPFGLEQLIAANRAAEWSFVHSVRQFAENTLAYARRELDTLLRPLALPPLGRSIAMRPVLIVSRGQGYKEDLAALRGYIDAEKPVLLGVDGGADALAAIGCRPDFIVGDMDSVSDATLRGGSQLLVHAYTDGRAPGLERLERLGLSGDIVAAPGTSEDVAMRIAFEQDASRIIIVGSHSRPTDFMEKGRQGMASTLLVRMMIGHKLLDARGASLWLGHRAAPARGVPGLRRAGLRRSVAETAGEEEKAWARPYR